MKKLARACVALTDEELSHIKLLSKNEQRTVSQIIRNMIRSQLHSQVLSDKPNKPDKQGVAA